MPTYLAPGVYVEEVPSAVKPIEGVGTSTAGFAGIVEDSVTLSDELGGGQVSFAEKKAKHVTSWDDFKATFGDFQAGNETLAHAVYGFFDNGGTSCYVVRVANKDAEAAEYGEALDTFKEIDEIAIVAIPGATDGGVQNAILSHCTNMGDRFAILDGKDEVDESAIDKAAISGANYSDKGYGALYFPWIEVTNPLSTGDDDKTTYAPPSGHIAGIYASTDATRGVHKAPANVAVRGASDVKYRLGRAKQEELNPAGVNLIRNFNGTTRVWGARTWSEDPEWKYITARRLFNFLSESIDEGTRWVVFEPNNQSLWQKIRRNVSAFLTNVWRSGALLGASPEDAFYVKCDAQTNPESVRKAGQVVTEIGVRLVDPAEFVIFRIQQSAGSPA